MTRRLTGLLIQAVLAASACQLMPVARQEPPMPCDELYSRNQCQAMIDVAASEVGKNRGDVAAISIVPDPPPEGVTLGAAWPIRVRLALKNGSTYETRMCGGVSIEPACRSAPHLSADSMIGGYRDRPCGVDPDDVAACATALPTVAPDAVAIAVPIRGDAITIPIDHTGKYQIPLGTGSLPNGILTEMSFTFAEAWPEDLAVRDGSVTLEIRSLEPDGKSFDNYYSHGWRRGVERVQASLRFDVLWFAPGATLELRNVVVR